MDLQRLKEAILKEKEKTDTLILAHTYQSPDIIDIADFSGDSYALSVKAAQCRHPRILLCGVRFMAETAKILSPEKHVFLPAPKATCPMAEQIPPARVRKFKEENPDAAVVAYINTTAQLKAECDVCVTSSSAVKILAALPQQEILFIPDKNLGAWAAGRLPEKKITVWDGCCPVHNQLTAADIHAEKARHPFAKVAVHPECPADVAALADFVGSTSAIIDYCLNTACDVILGTERNVCAWLKREHPERGFFQAAAEKLTCSDMQMTTLEAIYATLTGSGGEELFLPEPLRTKAKRSIDTMLKYGG